RRAAHTRLHHWPPAADRSGSTMGPYSRPPTGPTGCTPPAARLSERQCPGPASASPAGGQSSSRGESTASQRAERHRRYCCAKTDASPGGRSAKTATGHTSPDPSTRARSSHVGGPAAAGATGAAIHAATHAWYWRGAPPRRPESHTPDRRHGRPRRPTASPTLWHPPPPPVGGPPPRCPPRPERRENGSRRGGLGAWSPAAAGPRSTIRAAAAVPFAPG